MFGWLSATQTTFELSGSDSSNGPEYTSFRQLDEAPL